MARKHKVKDPHASLAGAMEASSAGRKTVYSQGRAEHKDHGARLAAIGGSFDALSPQPANTGATNAAEKNPSADAVGSGSANAGKF